MIYYRTTNNTHFYVDTPQYIVDFLVDVDPSLKTHLGKTVSPWFYSELFEYWIVTKASGLNWDWMQSIFRHRDVSYMIFPDSIKRVAYKCQVKTPTSRSWMVDVQKFSFDDVTTIEMHEYAELKLKSSSGIQPPTVHKIFLTTPP